MKNYVLAVGTTREVPTDYIIKKGQTL